MNKTKFIKYEKYLKMRTICKDAGVNYNNVYSQLSRKKEINNDLSAKLENQITDTLIKLIEV